MKQNLIYIFALILLTVVSCDEREVDNFQNPDERMLTVTASVPVETPETRSVTTPSNSKKIVVRFKQNEKINLYFKQDSKLIEVKDVVFSNVTNNNKTAEFKVKIPLGINPKKVFSLYGVYGTDSRIKDGRPFADIKTRTVVLSAWGLSDMQVPLYFSATVRKQKKPKVIFWHMGSMLVYHLHNKSNRDLTNIKTPFLHTLDSYQDLPYFTGFKEEANEEFSVDDGAIHSNPPNNFEYMLWIGKTRAKIDYLNGNNTMRVVQWVAPKNFEGRLPTTMFWYISTKHQSYYSNVMRAPKMYRGHAYHIGITYTEDANGNGRITAKASEKTTPNHMTLTSEENSIKLKLTTKTPADEKNVWIDLNDNGKKDDGEKVTNFEMYVTYTKIAKTVTLYGNITELGCSNNNLTSINVSPNTKLEKLYCSKNKLTSLDVKNSTNLKVLWCDQNQLTSLDVKNNTKLERLWCDENQLTSLDLKNNAELEELGCYKNQLTSLDVKNSTNLKILLCDKNQLTSLDVKNNTKLEKLRCSENQLTSLDVKNNTKLEQLSCSENQLTSLNTKSNTKLIRLLCSENQLTSLDVTSNTKLIKLSCYKNQLTSLNVKNNAELEQLHCYKNQLTSLNVKNSAELKELHCYKNQLTSLNVNTNTKLEQLWCYENPLTSLDVKDNTKLKQLLCNYTELTSLNIKNNTKLEQLWCDNNELTSLNIANGNNRNIKELTAYNNPELTCIQIDKNFAPPIPPDVNRWTKDATASWNNTGEPCP